MPGPIAFPGIPSTNGHSVPRSFIEKTLVEKLSEGYRPTSPIWTLGMTDLVPQFYLIRDIELMLIHPVVLNCLNFYKGGIAAVEFWGGPAPDGNPQGRPICPENDEIADFIHLQCQRFWERGVPKLQGGYEYGWIGCEAIYVEQDGKMLWHDFVQFSPRDVFLLTQSSEPVGIRVKQIRSASGSVPNTTAQQEGGIDLWMASKDIPAKGVWYAHNPRYNQFYGQSQLLGAWKPWRRLAWKDAAETVVDGGVFRFAYPGPLVKYPDEDYQAAPGTPATTFDSQGNPRRYARDDARQIVEWYKAGAGVGMSSSKYPADQGGGDKWSLEIPKMTLNVDGLIHYIKYLCDQISYGVGVPPELIASGETGSGYSGRAIPMESFIMLQQRNADALLNVFVDQVLRPEIRLNWGDVRFSVKVKPLLETKMKMQKGAEGAAGQPGQGANRPDLLPVPQNGQREQGGAPSSPSWGNEGPFSLNKQVEASRIVDIATAILRKRVA
jgi:hypothetical protein